MEKNKISIVVPVYNVESYLKKCLHSIVEQTYSNLEIILIDDGSTDRSGLLCDYWKKKDTRIQVIHQSNQGLSMARNRGLDLCSGDYIVFVDSDDWIDARLCEHVLQETQKHKAQLAVYKNFKFKKESEVVPEKTLEAFEPYSTKQAFYRMYAKDQDYMNMVNNKMFDANLFKNLRFTPNRLFEDALLMPQILDLEPKMIVSEQALYYYRRRENSIMTLSKTNRDSQLQMIQYHRERVEKYRDIKERSLYTLMVTHYLQNLIVVYTKDYQQKRKERSAIHKEFCEAYKKYKNQVDLDGKKRIKYILFYFLKDLCAQILIWGKFV